MSALYSDSPPPLPAWPREVFDYEPAHGFFQRLASANGQISARALMVSMGICGRTIDHAAMLDFCLRFPIKGREKLVATTPAIDGSLVTISGEVFSKKLDWSPSRSRVCRGCIGESRHHRNWFDLAVIDRCPVHDLPLERGLDGEHLAWWHPEVGFTPGGCDMALLNARRIRQTNENWERYVLGRIGVVEPYSVPLLDGSRLIDIIKVAELLGNAALFGWHPVGPVRGGKTLELRRDAVVRGFEVLVRGGKGIEETLRSFIQSREGKTSNQAKQHAAMKIWGWIFEAEPYLPFCEVTAAFRKEFSKLTAEFRVNYKTGAVITATQALMSLTQCAKKLDISKAKARVILEITGGYERSSDKVGRFGVSGLAFSRMESMLDDLIATGEATRQLKVSRLQFSQLVQSGTIKPFIEIGTGKTTHNRFLRSEIIRIRDTILGSAGRQCGVPVNRVSTPAGQPPANVVVESVAGLVS